MLIISFKCTPVKHSTLYKMYVTSTKHWNYTWQELERNTATYVSDKHVTLKKGQGHQTWYKLIAPQAKAVNCPAERGIPPMDWHIIMSKVWALIIDFVFISILK